MWVLSKQVLTVRHNVSHVKYLCNYLLLVENKGSLILKFILSFDIAEIYKYMLEMYNSVLDVNFFDNTIKPILYCYGIIQYLNLVQHGLLSCDNYFFLVIIQAFHDSSFKHRYQTIKWLFKNIFLFRGFSAQKKREQAFYKKLSRISEIYSLERGPFLFVVCNTTATKNTEYKILSLGDGRVCHSSSDSQIQTSPLTFLPISLPIMNLVFTVR